MMKRCAVGCAVSVAVVTAILLVACATNTVNQADARLWLGTWTSDDALLFKKEINSPDGTVTCFLGKKDVDPYVTFQNKEYKTWKDADGNIWSESFSTGVSGVMKGLKTQYLAKLSQDGTIMELQSSGDVVDFDPANFPKSLDLGSRYYARYLLDHR